MVKGAVEMFKNKEIIELTNLERFEFCLLNVKTGEKKFYNNLQISNGLTGLFFYRNNIFFALLPTTKGPTIYFNNSLYSINDRLTIVCNDLGNKGLFIIYDYDISITYSYSEYLGFDAWSNKEDIDIFYYIFSKYKSKSFYDMYTKDVMIQNVI